MTVRHDFVKSIESLLRKCPELAGMELHYGYWNSTAVEERDFYSDTYKIVFHYSDTDVNTETDKEEMIMAKWEDEDDTWGVVQSIAADSLSAILTDTMKLIKRL